MAGSTTESVGASTAEISGVFGRGVVENESLAAFGEVKCAGRSGRGGRGRHGLAGRGAAEQKSEQAQRHRRGHGSPVGRSWVPAVRT